MIEAMWILIAGAAIFLLGYFGKLGSNKMIALIIGAGLFLYGGFFAADAIWAGTFQIPGVTPTPGTGVAGVTFDIEMRNGSWSGAGQTGTVNDDLTMVTYQVDYDSGDNTFHGGTLNDEGASGSANFSIKPIVPSGSSNEMLVTIEANFDEMYKYGGEYVFASSGGVYEIDWQDNDNTATQEGHAIHTMLLSDSADWIELRWTMADGNDTIGDEFATVGESFNMLVTFSCGDWSDSFTVQWYVASTQA
jgi:hypothetical protein